MTVLVIGAGLVGSQIARILVEKGERPVLMDRAPQPQALERIVDLSRVKLVQGDVLQPLGLAAILREHAVTAVVHLAANPMLTIGAQKDPLAAIELNVMGTSNVLEAARVFRLKRVVVASVGPVQVFEELGVALDDMPVAVEDALRSCHLQDRRVQDTAPGREPPP